MATSVWPNIPYRNIYSSFSNSVACSIDDGISFRYSGYSSSLCYEYAIGVQTCGVASQNGWLLLIANETHDGAYTFNADGQHPCFVDDPNLTLIEACGMLLQF